MKICFNENNFSFAYKYISIINWKFKWKKLIILNNREKSFELSL